MVAHGLKSVGTEIMNIIKAIKDYFAPTPAEALRAQALAVKRAAQDKAWASVEQRYASAAQLAASKGQFKTYIDFAEEQELFDYGAPGYEWANKMGFKIVRNIKDQAIQLAW